MKHNACMYPSMITIKTDVYDLGLVCHEELRYRE